MSVCIDHHYSKKNDFSQIISICYESSQGLPPNTKKSNLIKQFKFWLNRSHQRRDLAKLDQRMLDDIGYSKKEASEEMSKPFWK